MKNGASVIKIAAAWLLALMLVIAAAVITVVLVNSHYFGPQKPVKDYLAALKDGNGAKAMGLLNASAPSANAAVLNGAGLAASQQGLSDVQVNKPVNMSGGRSKVTVAYTAAGKHLSTDFVLEPGPTHWLFFHSWTFVPSSLPTLDVSVVNEQQAAVNGVEVNMPGGKNSFAVFYPGVYKSNFSSQLFAAPAVSRTATSATAAPADVVLSTGPTSALLSSVNGKIHQYLDACAKQQVLLPTNCPMSSGTDNRVLSAVTWTIKDYPAVDISAYGGSWVLSPLTVKAEVSYKQQDLYTGNISQFSASEDFGFTAKMAVNGTSVSVTPVVSY